MSARLLVVLSLSPLSLPGASADMANPYENQKYSNPKDVPKAQQRDLNAAPPPF